jgi:hypothetical protein
LYTQLPARVLYIRPQFFARRICSIGLNCDDVWFSNSILSADLSICEASHLIVGIHALESVGHHMARHVLSTKMLCVGSGFAITKADIFPAAAARGVG